MKFTNEFILVTVVVFSILFLDLTGARASDWCDLKKPTGFSWGLVGHERYIQFITVSPHSAGCISVQSTDAEVERDSEGWESSAKITNVNNPHLACMKDGKYYHGGFGYKTGCFLGSLVLFVTDPGGHTGMVPSLGFETIKHLFSEKERGGPNFP